MALLEDIIEEVRQERISQDDKYGWPRNHKPERWLAILAEEFGEFAIDVNDCRFESGMWKDNMRNELIQVAAVAIAAIEDLDQQYEQEDKW
jgi:NTP pyrophosphatase (non-canonical NTP hydrolase)